VGAGPAGIGVLIAACNSGHLHALFAEGVVVLEKGTRAGCGQIGDYNINSDSHAESFLRCLSAGLSERFPELLKHPATLALDGYRGRAAPLPLVGNFLKAIARRIQSFTAGNGMPILTGVEALDASRTDDDRWLIRTRRVTDGAEESLTSQCLVIATGAEQSAADLRALSVGGTRLWPRYEDRLVLSSTVLTKIGLEAARQRLAELSNPKVAIIGGSHSALSAANALLNTFPAIAWAPGSISILHRKPMRPMYQTPALARADGFDAFNDDDICAKTGRVFPLAGFRSDSRELLIGILGLGAAPRERRIGLIDLKRERAADVAATLEQADIIIAATGYRPHDLPLFDNKRRRIELRGENRSLAMVDDKSRVLDASGRAVAGVFRLGLSAGFPLAKTHGEASFHAVANGLSLWNADIGDAIVRAVLDDAGDRADARRRPASRPALEQHPA
jgi:hypothetical protein